MKHTLGETDNYPLIIIIYIAPLKTEFPKQQQETLEDKVQTKKQKMQNRKIYQYK